MPMFERDLDRPAARHERRQHVVDVVLGYLGVKTPHENITAARSEVEPQTTLLS